MDSGVSFDILLCSIVFWQVSKIHFTHLKCSLTKIHYLIWNIEGKWCNFYLFLFRLTSPFNKRKIKELHLKKDMLQPQQHQASNMPASSIPTPKKIASLGTTSSALPVYQPPHTADTAANYNHSSGPSQQLKGFKSNMQHQQQQQSFIAHFVSSESRNSG